MASDGGLARLLAPVLSRVLVLKGRWRALLAFLAGASGAAAMAPLNFWPGMIIAMSAGLLLVDGVGSPPSAATPAMRKTAFKRAFWIGWIWGFGFFLPSLSMDTGTRQSFLLRRRAWRIGMAARPCIDGISMECLRHGAWWPPRPSTGGRSDRW